MKAMSAHGRHDLFELVDSTPYFLDLLDQRKRPSEAVLDGNRD
jgi:hypothetical protein